MNFMVAQLSWKNLRLRNQVLMILITESIVVFVIIFVIQYVLLQMIQETFMTSMEHIMIKEMKNKLNTQIWADFRSTTYIMNRNAFQILGMNTLFNHSRNLIEIVQPPDFLLNFDQMDEYAYNYAYTYSYFGNSPVLNDMRDSSLTNFTSLATEIFLMQDEFAVYFTTIRDDAYFAVNQGLSMVGYDPHIRPWYLYQIEHQDNIINDSPPYITWGTTVYVLTQTTNLQYYDGSLEGVIAGEYNFTQFIGNQIDALVSTIIIGQDGLIQMMADESQIGNYIYNQSVTGYSYLDFVDILHSSQQEHINQCTYDIDLLCLFNQSSGVENIIITKQIPRSDIIIMLQLAPSGEFQIIEEIVEEIVQKILQLTVENILVHFSARFITTLVSVALFFVISKPIYDLVAYTKTFSHNQQSLISRIKLNTQFAYRRQFDPIFEIKKAYFQLFNNLTMNSKCYDCIEIELRQCFCYEDISHKGFQNRTLQIKNKLGQICEDDYLIN